MNTNTPPLFPKIANYHNVNKDAQAYNRNVREEIVRMLRTKSLKEKSLLVVATEKLDGENFRIGVDKRGIYVGQRTKHLYTGEFHERTGQPKRHTHTSKFNERLLMNLEEIEAWLKEAYETNTIPDPYGKGMQDDVHAMSRGANIDGFYSAEISNEVVSEQITAGIFNRMLPTRDDKEMNGYVITNICLFGELCGDSMQRRFTWDFAGLDVFFYEMVVNMAVVRDGVIDYEKEKSFFMGWLYMARKIAVGELPASIKMVPPAYKKQYLDMEYITEVPYIWDEINVGWDHYRVMFDVETSGLSKTVIPLEYAESFTDRVNILKPITPKAVNYGKEEDRSELPGEGVVLSSVWPTMYPFKAKIKSDRFVEAHSERVKTSGPKSKKYVSPWVKFVTLARVEHGVERMMEDLDMQFEELTTMQIPDLINAVVFDIEQEEMDGEKMDKRDIKRVGNEAVRYYKNDILKIIPE